MITKSHLLVAVAMIGALAASASAQTLKQIPLPPSQNPSGQDLPFSAVVWGRNTLYVSGWLDGDLKAHTDTRSQTVGIFEDLEKLLASQKLTLGDVAMVRVYLRVDPSTGPKPDFAGMRAGYAQVFGTKDQPNKPPCTTLVVLPGATHGPLVEIDITAVRPT
jgi:enamine deaminase RidA (YjgF/YER057c/UK114 family)